MMNIRSTGQKVNFHVRERFYTGREDRLVVRAQQDIFLRNHVRLNLAYFSSELSASESAEDDGFGNL